MRFVLVLVFLLASCAAPRYFPGPETYQKYSDERVTLQTALKMAHSSYLKGCVAAHHEHSEKKVLDQCAKKASENVDRNFIFLIEQDGEKPGR